MVGNYERILEKIARISGLEKKEIEEKIETKRTKLSGLISKEGAAQVVASELGISFENEVLKINELLPGMRKVNTLGKVINLFPVRTFTTKKGEESKVVNFWVADDSSNIKVVLWDTNHIKLIEDGIIKEGSVVEIKSGSMREGELHLGNFSEIRTSNEIMDSVVSEKTFREKNISEFLKGENASTRAFVVQVFEPRFFEVCPECGKKVENDGSGFFCKTHDKIFPEKRAVLTMFIDDGTDSIRVVLFHELLKNVGITDFENPENLLKQRQELLGKEMIFSGAIKLNNFFNNLELVADNIKEVDIDRIIEGLEKN